MGRIKKDNNGLFFFWPFGLLEIIESANLNDGHVVEGNDGCSRPFYGLIFVGGDERGLLQSNSCV
jgi:hypothetical protein